MDLVWNVVDWVFGALVGLGLTDFEAGLLGGVLLMVFIGFLAFQLNIWWMNATAVFRPQRVMHATGQTPADVVSSSLGALLRVLALVVILIGLALAASGWVTFPDIGFVLGAGLLLMLLGVLFR